MRKNLVFFILNLIAFSALGQLYIENDACFTVKENSSLIVRDELIVKEPIANSGLVEVDSLVYFPNETEIFVIDQVNLKGSLYGILKLKNTNAFSKIPPDIKFNINKIIFAGEGKTYLLAHNVFVQDSLITKDSTFVLIDYDKEIELIKIVNVNDEDSTKTGIIADEELRHYVSGEGKISIVNRDVSLEELVETGMGFRYALVNNEYNNNVHNYSVYRGHSADTNITDNSLRKNIELKLYDKYNNLTPALINNIGFQFHEGDYPNEEYNTDSLKLWMTYDGIQNPYFTKLKGTTKLGNEKELLYNHNFDENDPKSSYNFTIAPENCKVVPRIIGIENDYMVCQGTNLELDLSISETGNSGIYKYLLEQDGQVIQNNNYLPDTSLNVVVETSNTDTLHYTLTIIDPKGCYSDTTFDLIVDPIPKKPDFDLASASCVNSLIPLSPKDTSNLLFEWSINGSMFSDKTIDTVLLDKPGNYQIQLNAFDKQNGCYHFSDLQEINVYRYPAFSIVADPVCNGSDLIFTIDCTNKDSAYFYDVFSEFYLTSDSIFPTVDLILKNNGNGNIDALTTNSVVVSNYNKEGRYLAVLHWAYANNTCEGTDTVLFEINPQPQAEISVAPVCQGDQSKFLVDVNNVSNLTFFWYIGNDTVTTYQTYLNYTLDSSCLARLKIVSSENCITEETATPIVLNKPKIDLFELSDSIICEGNLVEPQITTNGNYNNYFLDFGTYHPDALKTGSVLQQYSYKYEQQGKYWVNLKIFNTYSQYELSCTDSASKLLEVYPLPQVNFISDPVCYGDTSVLINISQANRAIFNDDSLTHYFWKNAGELLSNSVDFKTRFLERNSFTNNKYEIGLIVQTEKGCTDSITKNVEVLHKPVADFTFSKSICANQEVNIQNNTLLGQGFQYEYFWNFGDGSHSNQQIPGKQYLAGTYQAQVVIKENGNCSDTSYFSINVNPRPEAEILVSDDSVCFHEPVNFIAHIISGNILNYDWNLGVNENMHTPQFEYTYPISGTFFPNLKVTSDSNCIGETQKKIVVFQEVDASFSYQNDANFNRSVQFEPKMGNRNYYWNFGDESYESKPNGLSFNHIFPAEGIYNVQLKAKSNDLCVDSTIQQVTILSTPNAKFSISKHEICMGEIIHLSNESTISNGSLNSYWDLSVVKDTLINGDFDWTFTKPGKYYISLTTSANSYSDIYTDSIIVYSFPAANFSLGKTDYCRGEKINILSVSTIDIASYLWQINGAENANATDLFPEYTLNSTGSYNIQLQTTSEFGCEATSEIKTIEVYDSPDVSITANDACFNEENTFSIIRQNQVEADYFWNFGDGTNSIETQPKHTFSTPGLKKVRLTATAELNSDCKTEEEKNIWVFNNPRAQFEFFTTPGSNHIEFVNYSSPSELNYSWDFNADNIFDSNDANPGWDLEYGTTAVKLFVEDSNNCENSIIKNINLTAKPVSKIEVLKDSVCVGEDVVLVSKTEIADTSTFSIQWMTENRQTLTDIDTVSYSFSRAGTYRVILAAFANELYDYDTVFIEVLPKPTTAFAFESPNACAGTEILIRNYSSNADKYLWEIRGNNFDTLIYSQNIRKKFNVPGKYEVSLNTISNYGCQGAQQVDTLVIFENPVAEFSFNNACLGQDVQMQNLSQAPAENYQWLLNGQTYQGEDPEIVFNKPGSYEIGLVASTNHLCSDTIFRVIEIYPNPELELSVVPAEVCLGDSIQLSSTTNLNQDTLSYSWTLGNSAHVEHVSAFKYLYNDPGNYNINLFVATEHGCSTQKSVDVEVKSKPIAQFNADSIYCESEAVILKNTSIHSDFISWSVDGIYFFSNDSLALNMLKPGIHSILLQSFSRQGCFDSVSRKIEVQPRVVASFSATNVCIGDSVFFHNTSQKDSSMLVNYLWNFGDGAISEASDPIHLYENPGTYNVELGVTSGSCSSVYYKQITIYPAPKTQFSASDTCLGIPVQIINNTIIDDGTIAGQNWYLNGDFFSNSQSPVLVPNSSGTNTLKLISYSNYGCNREKEMQFEVFSLPEVEISTKSVCMGNPVVVREILHFANQYDWDFGDGTNGTDTVALHNYNSPGSYTIQLNATSNHGCKYIDTKEVSVFSLPVSKFSLSVGADSILHLINNSENAVQSNWEVTGPSFSTFSNSYSPDIRLPGNGTFFAKLAVMSSNQCADTLIKTVAFDAIPVAKYTADNVCANDTVFFINQSFIADSTELSFLWDFGDGTTSIQHNPVKRYTLSGTYQVQLKATSIKGKTSVFSKLVTIYSLPEPGFICDEEVLTGNFLEIQNTTIHTDSSSITYLWDFGDGTLSNEELPNKYYGHTGFYTIGLSAISEYGCTTDSIVSRQLMVYTNPVAQFSAGNSCANDSIVFINLSSITDSTNLSYLWDFGDGTTSTEKNPVKVYTQYGKYQVALYVTSVWNTLSSYTKEINVYQLPKVKFSSLDSICHGEQVQFVNLSNNADTVIYNWEFDDSTYSNEANPVKKYNNSGSFQVKLNAVSSHGCKNEIAFNRTLKVNARPVASFDIYDYCEEDTVYYVNTTIDNENNLNYHWIFDDNSYALSENPFQTNLSPGAHSASLVAVDRITGCASDTTTKDFNIHTIPQIDFGNRVFTCGNNYVLDAENTGSDYTWSDGSHLQTLTVSKNGTYSVLITNNNGCYASDSVYVELNGAVLPQLGNDTLVCGTFRLDAHNPGSNHLWSDGSSGRFLMVDSTGNYNVRVTDQNNCIGEDSIYIEVLPKPNIDFLSDTSLCIGDSLFLDAGFHQYYDWSNGYKKQAQFIKSAGKIKVTVYDADSVCHVSDSIWIAFNPNPEVYLGNDTAICFGEPIILKNTTNQGSFHWSNGADGKFVVVDSTETIWLEVKNIFGCSASDTVSVKVNKLPEFDLGENISLCAGDSVVLNPGLENVSYLWNNMDTAAQITVDTSGYYKLEISDKNNCKYSDDIWVMVHPVPKTILGEDKEFCSGDIALLDAGDMDSKYLWSTGDTNRMINIDTTGLYWVSVTNAYNCMAISDTVNYLFYNRPQLEFATDNYRLCEGDSLILDAQNPGCSYHWSDGSSQHKIIIRESGFYAVTVTGENNCSITTNPVSVLFNENPSITFNANGSFCNDTLIVLDAGDEFTDYLWQDSTTENQIIAQETGEYWVRVTDANNCSAVSDTAHITIHTSPTINFDSNNYSICIGDSVILDAQNPGSAYLWSSGDTSKSIVVKNTGQYNVTVSNPNGCVAISNAVNIRVNPYPEITLGEDIKACYPETVLLNAGSGYSNYFWSDGSSLQSNNIQQSGKYWVSVTNIHGCSSISDTINVIIDSVAQINLGNDISTCDSVIILKTNLSNVDFLWSNGSTDSIIAVDKTGNYWVKATSFNGCSSISNTITVELFSTPEIHFQKYQEACIGEIIELDAGNPGSDYLWNNGSTNRKIPVISSGEYFVTVTTENGCSHISDSAYIIFHNPPVVDLGEDIDTCINGSLFLSAGNSDFEYLWSNGSNLNEIEIDKSGYYAVTVTNQNNCTASDFIHVKLNGIQQQQLGNDTNICADENFVLDAGEYNFYLWNDGTQSRFKKIQATGNYWVTISNNQNCQSISDTIYVQVNPLPEVILPTESTSCEGNTVLLDAGTDASIYHWSNGAVTQEIEVSHQGMYLVTVTNAYGCSKVSNAARVVFWAKPSIKLGIDTALCSNESIILNAGNIGSEYLWQDGSKQQICVADEPGDYWVKITNRNNCSVISDTISLSFHPKPTIELGNDIELCEEDSILLNAGAGFVFYNWSNGANKPFQVITQSGIYSVEVTDTNGCKANDDIRATVHSNPFLELGPDIDICSGNPYQLNAGNTGSNYYWSSGENTQLITINQTGIYSVTVTNSYNCFFADSIFINIIDAPEFSLGNDTTICDGDSLLLSTEISGDEYLWEQGSTAPQRWIYEAGIYSLQITRDSLCTYSDNIEVSVNPKPATNLVEEISLCQGNSISISAGSPTNNYLWNDGYNLPIRLLDEEGMYIVTVTNSYNCKADDSITVHIFDTHSLSLGEDITTCADTNIVLSTNIENANYLWSDYSTDPELPVHSSGYYWLSITDVHNCPAYDEIYIDLLPVPNEPLSELDSACNGDELILNAGNPGSEYLWSDGSTQQILNIYQSGTYWVEIENEFGCSIKDTSLITFNKLPDKPFGEDTVHCGSITLNAANSGANYLWNNNTSESVLLVSESNNYWVRITNTEGCAAVYSINAIINQPPIVNLGADQEACSGEIVMLNAGNPGYNYQWNTQSDSQRIWVTESGFYWVRVYDSINCSANDTVNVLFNDLPYINLGADTNLCIGEKLVLNAGDGGNDYLWSDGSTNPFLEVQESGIYYIWAQNEENCSGADTINVNFNEKPVLNFTDTSSCDNVLLDAENFGSSYLWSNGPTTQTNFISESGLYIVTVTNSYQCTTFDSLQVNISHSSPISLGNDTSLCEGNLLILNAGEFPGNYNWNTGNQGNSIQVATTGYYTVQLLNEQGCLSGDDIYVEFLEAPRAELGEDKILCPNSAILLHAETTSNQSVLWQYNDSTISLSNHINATLPGIYTIQLTNSNGCKDVDSVIITQTNNGITAQFLVATDIHVFDTVHFVDLSFPDPVNYYWTFGNGFVSEEANPEVQYFSEGNYNVALNVTNTICLDSINKIIHVQGMQKDSRFITLDTLYRKKETKLIVETETYPNPTSGQFAVKIILNKQHDIHIQLLNLNGDILFQKELSNIKEAIGWFDISTQQPGIYLIRLIVGNETVTKKIIKAY